MARSRSSRASSVPEPPESETRARASASARRRDAADDGAPIPLERWVAVLQAQEVAAERGLDPASVLAPFGLTRAKWSAATTWWSRHFAENATRKGGELYARYVQLRAELASRRGG